MGHTIESKGGVTVERVKHPKKRELFALLNNMASMFGVIHTREFAQAEVYSGLGMVALGEFSKAQAKRNEDRVAWLYDWMEDIHAEWLKAMKQELAIQEADLKAKAR